MSVSFKIAEIIESNDGTRKVTIKERSDGEQYPTKFCMYFQINGCDTEDFWQTDTLEEASSMGFDWCTKTGAYIEGVTFASATRSIVGSDEYNTSDYTDGCPFYTDECTGEK